MKYIKSQTQEERDSTKKTLPQQWAMVEGQISIDPLTTVQLPHSNPTTTVGYAGKGTEK